MIEQVLKKEFNRIKPKISYQDFKITWLLFADKVGLIESSRNLKAKNLTTTAKGYYQFTDAALVTGYNRLARYGKFKRLPIIEQNFEIQTALFIANISQQKGSDKIIKGMLANNILGKKLLYAKFHHTNPDKATTKLLNKVFDA